MLSWNEQFETGHSVIDAQHKMLITYINCLEGMSYNTNPTRQDVESVLKFVDFLEHYTNVHFRHEEGCMHRNQCPAHQENTEAHRQFLVFFKEFKHRIETEGCRTEAVKELYECCGNWIRQHILRVDMQIKPCLKQGTV